MFSDLHPSRTIGTLVGAVITAYCLTVSGTLLLWRGLTEPIGVPLVGIYLMSAIFFGLACLFAYWTYGCATLRYHLDRNGLTIYWGDIRQLIPMDRIERLVPGRELPAPRITGVSWLGHHIGRATLDDVGETVFYSTHRKHEELLYVVTAEQTYAISVPDEVRFAEDLQGHQKMGQMVSLPQVTERMAIAAHPFWHDPLAQVLALASVAAFTVTLGYVFQQYPGLPETIPLEFPTLGGVIRVDDKSELLTIPVTGIGLLTVNLVLGFFLHAWERTVGYLLFLAAAGAQVILLAAAIITLNQ